MRLGCLLLPALLVAAMIGCTTDAPIRSTAWFKSRPGFHGLTGNDVVQIEWALLECPVGDHYLNEKLWTLTNEQIVPLERKAILEDNGLRIAQLGGLLPTEFQDLLHSERTNPRPRRRQVRAGQSTTLPLGPIRTKCHLKSLPGISESANSNEFVNTTFGLLLTPTMASDGKVRLSILPQVQFGDPKVVVKPTEDGSGWSRQEQVRTEHLDALKSEVVLTAEDYLLIGGWFGRQETFGQEAFIRVDEPRPVQRLLVVRVGAQLTEPLMDVAEDETAPTAPPIAAQAPRSTSRWPSR